MKEKAAVVRLLQVNIRAAMAELRQAKDVPAMKPILALLHSYLSTSKSENLWSEVDDVVVFQPLFWSIAPSENRLRVICSEMFNTSLLESRPDMLEFLVDVVEYSSWQDLPRLNRLPKTIWERPEIFQLLSPELQLTYGWETLQQRWSTFDSARKTLSVYKAAQEGLVLDIAHLAAQQESDPLVRAALLLLWARDNPPRRAAAFQKAHATIQEHVIDIAFNSEKPLKLDMLLPPCPLAVVEYCEARDWRQKEQDLAFCPRTKRGCEILHLTGPQQNTEPAAESLNLTATLNPRGHARLTPERGLHWTKWSLIELLDSASVSPSLPDGQLRNPVEYVPKLSGWVNRLNEIRERLKCSRCGHIMKPNYAYAKNLARYNTTIVSCTKGEGHDQNVYLNHCWSCLKVIDSRESRIQVEGFYVCIHCGNAARDSKTHRAGDICPQCGEPKMFQSKYQGDTLVCRKDTKHKIRPHSAGNGDW